RPARVGPWAVHRTRNSDSNGTAECPLLSGLLVLRVTWAATLGWPVRCLLRLLGAACGRDRTAPAPRLVPPQSPGYRRRWDACVLLRGRAGSTWWTAVALRRGCARSRSRAPPTLRRRSVSVSGTVPAAVDGPPYAPGGLGGRGGGARYGRPVPGRRGFPGLRPPTAPSRAGPRCPPAL